MYSSRKFRLRRRRDRDSRQFRSVRSTTDGASIIVARMVETLGHYKILDRIGAGTLGDVYRARDTRLGRTVAVKLPGAELQADRATARRAARTTRAPPRCCRTPTSRRSTKSATRTGRLFLVFEFVPGEPLKRVIAGRPLNMRRAVDLATQMADALAEAHAADIVHGDLTPDTVMITPKGNAKILDFGFVRWKKSPTPDGESDHRTDIEALGALLFEMLTGSRRPRRRHGSAPRCRASSTRLSARHSARMRRAATKRPRRCAAELRSVAAILDVRAASADPARVGAGPPRTQFARAGSSSRSSSWSPSWLRCGACSVVVQAFRPAV